HVGDALGAEKGAAEIAAHDVAEPMEILHDERIAETEIGHVAGALDLGEFGEALGAKNRDKRVARQDPQDGEDDDRDPEHRQPAEHQPPHDIAVHEGRLRVAAGGGQEPRLHSLPNLDPGEGRDPFCGRTNGRSMGPGLRRDLGLCIDAPASPERYRLDFDRKRPFNSGRRRWLPAFTGTRNDYGARPTTAIIGSCSSSTYSA